MKRLLAAEFLGTCFLLIGVVGSGVMGDQLSGGSDGLALLANSLATGAILYVLITILGPISGAHFNPAVTLAFRLHGEIETSTAIAYSAVQVTGGVIGVWLAHLMFELPMMQVSTTIRSGSAQWFSELIAAAGLVGVILGGIRYNKVAIPALVGLYISGAYWFTSSTSFANPAVTIARGFTDTFAGILPADVPMFIVMQIAGAVLAVFAARFLFSEPDS